MAIADEGGDSVAHWQVTVSTADTLSALEGGCGLLTWQKKRRKKSVLLWPSDESSEEDVIQWQVTLSSADTQVKIVQKSFL